MSDHEQYLKAFGADVTPFKVFYMMAGSNPRRIESSLAVGIDQGRIILKDGGWIHARDGFFTEAQCRQFYGLPPKDWHAASLELGSELQAIVSKINGLAATLSE